MQCPSCGFENIPGREECAICSTRLTKAAERESVMPPRAKDRTIRQHIRWRFQSNRPFPAVIDRIHDFGNSLNNLNNNVSRIWNQTRLTWSWLTLRNLWILFISIIPGLGYIFGRRDKLTGLRYLYGSLAALLLAALTFRTYIADVLIWGIAVSSVISIYVAADSIIPAARDEELRFLSRFGITLLVISAVCSGYILAVFASSPYISHATVIAQPLTDIVTVGDRLLLWNGDFKRGDVVVGHMVAGQAGIGVVVGIPGDRVQVSSNGTAYLNGKPLKLPPEDPDLGANPDSILSYGNKVISEGELLILQTIQGGMGDQDLHNISEMGYVSRGNVLGRVVAVTGPPSHRKLIRNNHLNQE